MKVDKGVLGQHAASALDGLVYFRRHGGAGGVLEADGVEGDARVQDLAQRPFVEIGVVRALAQEGQAVYAIDPFGTGKNTGEQDPEAPRGSGNFFTTFNRTDAAERVYDTVLAVRHLLATQTGPIQVVGLQEAGLWGLLAVAAVGPEE